jgi:hydroxymethylbilane synthase
MRTGALILATRGSPLARWQAGAVADRLAAAHPGLCVALHVVRTAGDREQQVPVDGLSATGVFTREVDEAVLRRSAHAAVHSLKDQPALLPPGLLLGMVLERGPVEDVLVGRTLAGLRPEARVATGSPRRAAQLRRVRPDLAVVGIRGNVETRIAALDRGAAEALLLARAGLVRLGLEARVAEILPLEDFLPAPRQGIVGVTCREDDGSTRALLAAAGDPVTHRQAEVETGFLARLGGGCHAAVAALAVPDGDRIHFRARVLDPSGSRTMEGMTSARAEAASAAAVGLAEELLLRGAGRLLAEARG